LKLQITCANATGTRQKGHPKPDKNPKSHANSALVRTTSTFDV